MNKDQLINEWTAINAPFGRMLGYPECCIKEFCSQPPEILAATRRTVFDVLRYEAGKVKGKFTGFVPCRKHAALITLRIITLESLIKNRSADLKPFPLEEYYEK